MDTGSAQGGQACRSRPGGWWYNHCYHSDLNGPYQSSPSTVDDNGVSWGTFGDFLKLSETKMRRN